MGLLDIYDRARGSLDLLAGSWVRAKPLLALLDGEPRGSSELTDLIGAKGKTVSHSLSDLVSGNLIRRSGTKYSLTNIGRIEATMLADQLATLSELENHADFWNGHSLSSIPPSLQARIGQLAGGKLYQGTPESPLESQAAFIGAMHGAKKAWGVSPIMAHGYTDMVFALLDSGADVRLILAEGVIAKITPAELNRAKSYDNLQIYAAAEAPRIGFTVTDKLVSIALFGQDGRYDPTQDLIAEGGGAVQWGEELFDYYLEKIITNN